MLTHNRRNYGSRPPRGFRRCHHPGPSSTPRRASSSRPRSAPQSQGRKIFTCSRKLGTRVLVSVLYFTLEPPIPPSMRTQCERTAGRLTGLSPRMRGNQQHASRHQQCAGSIPAHAGEPSLIIEEAQEVEGLSPRMRGNRRVDRRPVRRPGSIPAHAGEPCHSPSCAA